MKVLMLVTTQRPFFEKQIEVLEAKGISIDVIEVPGEAGGKNNRTYFDYAKFYFSTVYNCRYKYDIIHANYGLTAPFALLQPRRPVVLSLWGSDLMGKYQKVSSFSARYCDEVIVMSPHMAQRLDRKVHVIPHGVDLDLFKQINKDKAQTIVGWKPSNRHVLFPYNPLRTTKNFDLAQKVVKEVNENMDVEVVLHPVYNVEHEEIPIYMNASDALLLTSNREGSPNSVKEAMACNLPVVGTNVGDVKERLDGVHPSAVCNTKDELISNLQTILTENQRSNGRDNVKSLSLDNMGDNIIDVYKSAINPH